MSLGSILYRLITIRRQRLLLPIICFWLVYIFFRYLPTDVPPVSQRHDSKYEKIFGGFRPPNPPASNIEKLDSVNSQNYDGPVQFFNLGSSLRAAYSRNDAGNNVLLAVSNLKSTTHIIPLACEMAGQKRSRIHVAFMGREEVSLKSVLSANGILPSDCPILWHDGRPDYARQSSEKRMELSVGSSLGHVHKYLSLQAVLIDSSVREDAFFIRAMEQTTKIMSLTLITLPKSGVDSTSWISSLDASSLKQWGRAQIDILIHAATESSGSLVRLLKSIKQADYSAIPFPRLIIELPTKVDPFTTKYLTRFRWPPGASDADSKLIVRHRIESKSISPAHASLRTVESFYPANPALSHVLVLSPDVEVSPNYFQFAMYALLEFKYGSQMSPLSDNLLGLALDLPINDLIETNQPSPLSSINNESMSLWQMPTSRAGLFFGEKWVELHTFMSNRVTSDPDLVRKVGGGKTISDKFPAWLKIMFELMRARGYFMLYPVVAQRMQSPLVTVHHELHQSPEEYTEFEEADFNSINQSALNINEGQVLYGDKKGLDEAEAELPILSSTSVAALFGESDQLHRYAHLELDAIPLFSFSREQMRWNEIQKQTSIFADEFSLSLGGCASLQDRDESKQGTLEYLFCVPAG